MIKSGNDELNSLGYTSSAPDLIDLDTDKELNQKDVADLSTLQRVASLLRDRKRYYDSVQSITVGEDLTVENQMIVNKRVIFHIQELESLIIGAIKNVKELTDERQR